MNAVLTPKTRVHFELKQEHRLITFLIVEAKKVSTIFRNIIQCIINMVSRFDIYAFNEIAFPIALFIHGLSCALKIKNALPLLGAHLMIRSIEDLRKYIYNRPSVRARESNC